MRCIPSPLVLAGILGLGSPLHAIELADIVGDWTLGGFDSPSALRETFYNSGTDTYRFGTDSSEFAQPGEVMTDVNYPDPVVTQLRAFSISPTGAVTGDETGQILSISGNRLFYSDGVDETTVFCNTSGDIMLTSSRDVDQQDQTICLKRPASLTTSQLEGQWRVFSMINRANIQKTFFSGSLVDTFYAADASNVAGDITIQNDGTFTGLFNGTVVASATTPGDLTVTVDGNEIAFKCNASVNLCVATTGDANEQEIILLVRKPATLATADLAGTWRISAMVLPTTLTETWYKGSTDTYRQADNSGFGNEGEVLVDVFHPDPFELLRLHALVDATGAFTGSVTGSLAVVGGETVSVTVDGETFSLQPNADKTFMAGIRQYPNSHELIYMVKVCANCAPDFESEVDMQPVAAGERIIFSWNNGSNLSLRSSSSLGGGWTAVEGSEGADTHAVVPSGARFFQVTEAIAE